MVVVLHGAEGPREVTYINNDTVEGCGELLPGSLSRVPETTNLFPLEALDGKVHWEALPSSGQGKGKWPKQAQIIYGEEWGQERQCSLLMYPNSAGSGSCALGGTPTPCLFKPQEFSLCSLTLDCAMPLKSIPFHKNRESLSVVCLEITLMDLSGKHCDDWECTEFKVGTENQWSGHGRKLSEKASWRRRCSKDH